jgi:hypothetical protein
MARFNSGGKIIPAAPPFRCLEAETVFTLLEIYTKTT